jgi:serine protease Do
VIRFAEGVSEKGLGSLSFAESANVHLGDFTMALGAPFGLEASLSSGIVSAVGRGSLGITKVGDFLQTDAAINPGNSGGPLIGVDGRVIGVNTAIFSRSGAFAGIGFAVPASMAKLVTDRLIKDGKIERGYLGVSLQALNAEMKTYFDIPTDKKGVLVAEVEPESPGGRAGIEAGDIIVTVNQQPVNNPGDIVNMIALLEPEAKVELSLWRDGKEQKKTVTVGRWPDQNPAEGEDNQPGKEDQGFGLSLAPLSRDLKQQFGYESNTGAIIVSVRPDSAAQKAGLSVGDVIVEVDRKPVTSPEQAVAELKRDSNALLRIERQGAFLFVPIETRRDVSH